MTTKQLRTRLVREDSGFTLIELLVTMSIATIILFAILQGADSFARGSKRADDVTKAQDAARSTMREMVTTIREGRLPTAAQAGLPTAPTTPVRVADAATGDVVLATGTAASPGWTRYCADGAGSLVVGRLPGASYAAPGTCGTNGGGWTYGRLLDRTLPGGATGLFEFSSGSCVAGQPVGAGAVCPAPATAVTTVGIQLSVAGSPGSETVGATIRNAASVRNGSPS